MPELEALRNDQGEETMEWDDEYAPTDEEMQKENDEEPLMMQNAQTWDNFIALVAETSRPWPQGVDEDTDDYRKGRALAYFNKMAVVANDVLRLKPEMLTWVPHVALYIVPRQMVTLGDPTRRSCDACESFGAMVKKLIKHNTCRRTTKEETEHKGKSKTKAWKQHFSRGFLQQAFSRACVRESLQHGPENVAFLQRADARRTRTGKGSVSRKAYASASVPLETIYELAKKRKDGEDE